MSQPSSNEDRHLLAVTAVRAEVIAPLRGELRDARILGGSCVFALLLLSFLLFHSSAAALWVMPPLSLGCYRPLRSCFAHRAARSALARFEALFPPPSAYWVEGLNALREIREPGEAVHRLWRVLRQAHPDAISAELDCEMMSPLVGGPEDEELCADSPAPVTEGVWVLNSKILEPLACSLRRWETDLRLGILVAAVIPAVVCCLSEYAWLVIPLGLAGLIAAALVARGEVGALVDNAVRLVNAYFPRNTPDRDTVLQALDQAAKVSVAARRLRDRLLEQQRQHIRNNLFALRRSAQAPGPLEDRPPGGAL